MHDAPDSSLKRDHRLIVGALIVVIALCWAWIVPMARDMYTTMTGSSAWMMTNRWDFAPWKRAHLDGFRSSPQCSAAQVTPEGSGGFRIGLDHGREPNRGV